MQINFANETSPTTNMKIAALLLLGVGVALSEPPVPSNRYLPGRNAPPQQQYGVPSNGNPSFDNNFQGPNTKYGAPSTRSYLPPIDNHNTEIRGTASFGSEGIITPSSQYGVPVPVAKYGAPSTRNYLPPVTNHQSLSEIRGAQFGNDAIVTPSSQYGVPVAKYGAPTTRNYLPPVNTQQSFSRGTLSGSVPVAKYGAPSTRNYLPPINNQAFETLSEISGTPSFGNDAIITPSQYDISEESTPVNHQFSSSFPSTSNAIAPNAQYGVPSTPVKTYGTPSFDNGVAVTAKFAPQLKSYLPPSGGYLRNMENDGPSEPANYDFKYDVQDENDFGHQEERHGDGAQGKYYVQLPDGRRQTVEYTADHEGYKPTISYEETNNGHSTRVGGYGHGRTSSDGYQY